MIVLPYERHMFCIGNVLPSRPRLEKVEKGLEIEREMAKAMDQWTNGPRMTGKKGDVDLLHFANRNHIRIFVG